MLAPLTASETMTLGTAVGGAGTTGTKPLLVRAAGPSLTQFGVAGVMADPKLDLFRGQTVIDSNDNWVGGTALSAAFNNVGAFALGATSRDAALVVTLQPGNYTAQVSGVGGASGATLVEIYEVP